MKNTDDSTASEGSLGCRVRPVDARICCRCSNLVTTDATCPLCHRPTKPHPERTEKIGYCQGCTEGPIPLDELHLVTWNEDPHWQMDDGGLCYVCRKCHIERLLEETDWMCPRCLNLGEDVEVNELNQCPKCQWPNKDAVGISAGENTL